ncbi:MAG: TIGR04076 family protein, partial [Deltaproteobacteria bacterium]
YYPWLKQKGVAIACCTDGLRPVIFKLERIED